MANILIVDDDERIRKLLLRMLEGAGHDVAVAADGDAAIARFRQRGADIILADILMPGKDGIEMILELRREAPELKIIAMSGGGRIGPGCYLGIAEKLGASYTLAKPFSRDEVVAAVEEVLARPAKSGANED